MRIFLGNNMIRAFIIHKACSHCTTSLYPPFVATVLSLRADNHSLSLCQRNNPTCEKDQEKGNTCFQKKTTVI